MYLPVEFKILNKQLYEKYTTIEKIPLGISNSNIQSKILNKVDTSNNAGLIKINGSVIEKKNLVSGGSSNSNLNNIQYVKRQEFLRFKILNLKDPIEDNTKNIVSGNLINNFKSLYYPYMFNLSPIKNNISSKIILRNFKLIGIGTLNFGIVKNYFNSEPVLRLISRGIPMETTVINNRNIASNIPLDIKSSISILENGRINGPYNTNTPPGNRRKQVPNPSIAEKNVAVNGIERNLYTTLETYNDFTLLFFFIGVEDVINLTVFQDGVVVPLIINKNYDKLLNFIQSDTNQLSSNIQSKSKDLTNFNETKNLIKPLDYVEIEFMNDNLNPALIRTQNVNYFKEGLSSYPQEGVLYS